MQRFFKLNSFTKKLKTMKRFLLSVMVMCAAVFAQAQVVVEDDIDGSKAGNTAVAGDNQSAAKSKSTSSGFGFDYLAIEDAIAIGMRWDASFFLFEFDYMAGETNKYVKESTSWNIGLGANYRHWLAKWLYVEGSAALAYYHSKVEYDFDGENRKEKGNEVGLYVTPRVGLRLIKTKNTNISVVGGYRWDFIKFKFDKDHMRDNFTVGISITM